VTQTIEIPQTDLDAIQNSRILIVDDQQPNVALLERILKHHGYRQHRAVTDSREAIAAFREYRPDLVLLDLMMPELDGYAILTQLQPLTQDDPYLPVLVVTADASQQAKQRALALGTKDFLTKPIDATETALRIHNLLKTRWLYRQIRRQADDLMQANEHLRANNRVLTDLHRQISALMAQAGAQVNCEREPGPTVMSPEAMLTRIGELIAARDQLEDQLRQSQKMEAMGRLAAGIAHDFNNLLTVIVGFNDLLRAELAESTSAQQNAEEVSQAAGRASALTRQLLAFSRQQVARPRVIDLNDSVQRLEKMLGRIIEADIELELVCAGDVHPIKVDPAQIDQVVMNLVVNARDAMPNGGRVTIQTAGRQLTEADVAGRSGICPGPHTVLTVKDTGIGMTPETQARLFEPFFTTKEKGKGTGLGLSIVHGIVKQNGGDIVVQSEPGRGTAFHIYFPATGEEAEAALFEESSQPAASAGDTILLVEDDDHVRRLTREILARQGYQVREWSSPTAALQSLREDAGGVSLLLTDLLMPEMNGLDLAREVAQLRPGIRVVFISGYTDRDLATRAAFYPDTTLLEKPFTAASLLASVRQSLAS
jgi:signal transduction histidine kinase